MAEKGTSDLLIVSWGSTRGVIEDVIGSEEFSGKKIAHVHYQVLWPLDVSHLQESLKQAKKVVLVESNMTAQFGQLLRVEGVAIDDTILKYDGRPFFYDELHDALLSRLS